MKKLFSLLLVVAMILSLCACSGGNNAEDDTSEFNKNITDSYVGTWVYDTGKGNVITYHFNKGGVGYYEQSTMADTRWDFSWEVKDGVIITTRNAVGTTFYDSFEWNNNEGALYMTTDGKSFGPYKKSSK